MRPGNEGDMADVGHHVGWIARSAMVMMRGETGQK